VIDHAENYTTQTQKREAKKNDISSGEKNLNDLFVFDIGSDFEVRL